MIHCFPRIAIPGSTESTSDDNPTHSPALLTIATICLKSARRSFVSPFAWRVAVYNNSRGKVETTQLLNRLLISASYSFIRKAKLELSTLRETAYDEVVKLAGEASSSDNIQRQSTPSTASNKARARIVVVTQTSIANWIHQIQVFMNHLSKRNDCQIQEDSDSVYRGRVDQGCGR